MTVPAIYLPAAEDDIESAWSSYESIQHGLGDRFADAVFAKINLVCENPLAYGLFRRKIRACPVRKFPFVVYYIARESDVLIVAVQHGRRSSRRWRDRT